jgi:hypothetical protein
VAEDKKDHGGKSPGPMHSKAQWRFLMATHKTFAHRWAHQVEAEKGKVTGYRSLPDRKGVRKR